MHAISRAVFPLLLLRDNARLQVKRAGCKQSRIHCLAVPSCGSLSRSNLLVFLIFMEGQQRINRRSAHRVFRMRTGTLVRKFKEGLSSGHSMRTHFKTQCDAMEKLAQTCHVSLVPNAE